MGKLEKVKQVYKLSTAVKKKLTVEQQAFIKEHNFTWNGKKMFGVVLNPTDQDRKMVTSIAERVDVHWITLVEGTGDPEKL